MELQYIKPLSIEDQIRVLSYGKRKLLSEYYRSDANYLCSLLEDVIFYLFKDDILYVELLSLFMLQQHNRSAILQAYIPSFNQYNIQPCNGLDFQYGILSWFRPSIEFNPKFEDIAYEIKNKRLFDRFANKTNYHRYIFLDKLIVELSLTANDKAEPCRIPEY